MSIGQFVSTVANAARKETGDSFSLSGTAIAPRIVSAFGIGMGVEVNAVWCFAGVDSGSIQKGYTNKADYISGNLASYTNDNLFDFVTPKDWSTTEAYMRATLDSGDAPTAGTLNTWLSLYNGTSFFNRFYRWSESGGFGTTAGTIKVEISTESDGSNIVATGYYRGVATKEL